LEFFRLLQIEEARPDAARIAFARFVVWRHLDVRHVGISWVADSRPAEIPQILLVSAKEGAAALANFSSGHRHLISLPIGDRHE
jgi:hypothetical protein